MTLSVFNSLGQENPDRAWSFSLLRFDAGLGNGRMEYQDYHVIRLGCVRIENLD